AAVGRALEAMPDVEALPGVWASQRTDPGLLLSGVVTPEVPWDEAMAALDVPALLLTGDRPGSARVGREGLETAARNPRVSPVLVPGAGHQVRRSAPEAFYRAVDEWLSEVLPVG
ncbi:alpha/beta fold hydrolase, partial [Actinomyces naeslundii]